MSININEKFSGSRNYIDEHVSDYIWTEPPGTKFIVTVLGEDEVEVEFLEYGKDPSTAYMDDINSRRTWEEKKISEDHIREKMRKKG